MQSESGVTANTGEETSGFRPPALIAAREIADPIERNNQFNAWYHKIDVLMRGYMRVPTVPSWATFGKHASFTAGVQLTEVLDALDGVRAGNILVDDLSDGVGFNWKEITTLVSEVRHVLSTLDIFLLHPGILPNINRLIRSNGTGLHRQQLEASLDKVQQTLIEGNLRIYEFMAPNFLRFIAAAGESPDGIPSSFELQDDTQGHLTQAFHHYAKTREMALDTSSPNHAVERMTLSFQANLMAVFNEQMNRVQPLYEAIIQELHEFTGSLQIDIPSHHYKLLPEFPEGSWANLYDRMGIDSAKAPLQANSIEPSDLPHLLRDEHDPRFVGTIGHLFLSATKHPDFLAQLMQPPTHVTRRNLW